LRLAVSLLKREREEKRRAREHLSSVHRSLGQRFRRLREELTRG
jgi:hypothetical protein